VKKKICLTVVILFLSVGFFGCAGKSSDSDEFINVYSWGEFISSGAEGNINVNKEFTEKTGIRVNYKTFQSNEELFAKLSAGGADYDVIIPSDYMVSRLIENDMLAKLDFENIPNFSLIDDNFKNLDFDRKNEYSVPYMWGIIGIFYNKSEIQKNEQEITWDILWDEKYKDKILMFDNARDSFAISFLRLGYSINTTDSENWKHAADELIKQKPLVQAYVMDQIFDKMANGEAALAPYYSGDAATMTKNNPNIGFVIPKSGTNLFVDSMCVPKNSIRKTQAEKYINFMCETDIALANVKQTGYSTPQKEAYEKLDDSIKQNKIFYPDDETIQNSQVFINLTNNINKLMDELWIEVKSGDTSSDPWMLVAILVGFVIIYVAVVLYKKVKSNGL
jgi:spermidine/putrescine transport system substrate-binding protein